MEEFVLKFFPFMNKKKEHFIRHNEIYVKICIHSDNKRLILI